MDYSRKIDRVKVINKTLCCKFLLRTTSMFQIVSEISCFEYFGKFPELSDRLKDKRKYTEIFLFCFRGRKKLRSVKRGNSIWEGINSEVSTPHLDQFSFGGKGTALR